MSRISVIIPVFNAATYLPRCLDSLLNQTFQDWEALCVDDGSTDGSGRILDEYAAKDSRFRVVHQPNGGVSRARNLALGMVQTPYLQFMDSDDFLHPQALSLCLRLIERDGSDVVAFRYDHAYRSRIMIRHLLHLPDPVKMRFRHLADPQTYVTDDLLLQATEYSKASPGQDPRWLVKHCHTPLCLYRSELVRDIRFPAVSVYEDFPWWGEMLRRARKATILNVPLYFYYPNRRSSILSSGDARKIESLRTLLPMAETIFRDETPERKKMWEERFLQPFRDKLKKKERRQAS